MRPHVRRGRRGATLPLVCILLTAVLGSVALAVDLGRLYYAGTEVQTAVDAAALAAVRYQQYHTLSGMSGVQSAAQAVAALNTSGGQPVQVQAQDVAPVTYDPKTRAITASNWNTETYAFTVTAQAAVPAVIGGVSRVVRRSATAWLANVNGGNCVRPVAVGYTRFYESGVTWDDRYSSIGAVAPDFNFWDISSTQDADLQHRTFTVLPPWAKKSYWDAQTPEVGYDNGNTGFRSHANWEPVDFNGGGLDGFVNALDGREGTVSCNGNTAAVGDVKQPWVAKPTPPSSDPALSDSANLILKANYAMTVLCNRVGDLPDAFCRDSTGKVGVKTRIVLTDSVVTNGVWVHKVREVGVARVMCYFQSRADICNPQPMNEPPSAVGTWKSRGPFKGYPAGTFVILLDTPGSTKITPDVVLGTKPGLTQRVLLAK